MVSIHDSCQDELGLNASDHTYLEIQANLFQKVWSTDNSTLYDRNGNNTCENDIVQSIASTYLESGWNSGETCVSPGRYFWQNHASAKYCYPGDKEHIKAGLIKLFTKIQEGQEPCHRMQAGKNQRSLPRELDYAELGDSDYPPNLHKWGTHALTDKDMENSKEIIKQLGAISHESVGESAEPEQYWPERVSHARQKPRRVDACHVVDDPTRAAPIQDDGPETFQSYKSVSPSLSSENGSTDENSAADDGKISSIGILGARSCQRPINRNWFSSQSPSSSSSPLQKQSSSDLINAETPSDQSRGGDGRANKMRRIIKFNVSKSGLSRIINRNPSSAQQNGNVGTLKNSLRLKLERKANESNTRKRNMDFQTSEGVEISPPRRLKGRKPAIEKNPSKILDDTYSEISPPKRSKGRKPAIEKNRSKNFRGAYSGISLPKRSKGRKPAIVKNCSKKFRGAYSEINPPKRSKGRKPAIEKNRSDNFEETYSAGQSPGPSTGDTGTQKSDRELLHQKDLHQNQAEDHQQSSSQHGTDNDDLTPTQGCLDSLAQYSNSASGTNPFIFLFWKTNIRNLVG